MGDTGGSTERPDAKPVHPQPDKSGKGTDQRDGYQTRDPKAADRIVDQPDRLTDYDSDVFGSLDDDTHLGVAVGSVDGDRHVS